MHSASNGFPRDFRPAPRGAPDRATTPRYSRRSGRFGGLRCIVSPDAPSLEGGRFLSVTDDPDHTWRRIEGELRERVPADMYEIWLAPLRLIDVDGSQVIVEAPRELRAWVAERFARVLQASAVAVLGPDAVVRVRPGDEGPRRR